MLATYQKKRLNERVILGVEPKWIFANQKTCWVCLLLVTGGKIPMFYKTEVNIFKIPGQHTLGRRVYISLATGPTLAIQTAVCSSSLHHFSKGNI